MSAVGSRAARYATTAAAGRTLAAVAHARVLRQLLLVALLHAVTCVAGAQELNPRAYLITPVGTNAINLGYSHLAGVIDVAGSAPIEGAKASTDLAALGYYRSFGFLGRAAIPPWPFLVLYGGNYRMISASWQYGWIGAQFH
jgi:hypothetical protein